VAGGGPVQLGAPADPRGGEGEPTVVAAGCSSTELRTEWSVRERATERRSVRASAWATDLELRAILFGVAVNLSCGGSVHVPGPGARNGSS